MENRLPCEIVQDLLPSYVDGLTNEVTNQAVESHVQTCKKCRQCLKDMNVVIEPEISEYEEKEIDFLKKTKRRHRRILGISVAAVVCAVLCIVAFVRIYLIGEEVSAEGISCQVEVETSVQEDGSTETEIQANGVILDAGLDVTKVEFSEEDGIVTIEVKGGAASPFRQNIFEENYTAAGEVKQIFVGNRIIWEQGESISSYVAGVYETKHPYVGDKLANGATAGALGMNRLIGGCTSELQTSQEPYGWILRKEKAIRAKQEKELLKKVESVAYVMIAMTDNLDYMTYEYVVDGVEKKVTFDYESAPVKKDLKKVIGSSAKELSLFMKQQGLCEGTSNPEWNGSKTLQIRLANAAEDEVMGLGFAYYLDGKLIGTEGTICADESAFQPGEIIYFDLEEGNFASEKVTDISRVTIEVTVRTKDGQEQIVKDKIDVDAKTGYSYPFVLRGNEEAGYTLE